MVEPKSELVAAGAGAAGAEEPAADVVEPKGVIDGAAGVLPPNRPPVVLDGAAPGVEPKRPPVVLEGALVALPPKRPPVVLDGAAGGAFPNNPPPVAGGLDADGAGVVDPNNPPAVVALVIVAAELGVADPKSPPLEAPVDDGALKENPPDMFMLRWIEAEESRESVLL